MRILPLRQGWVLTISTALTFVRQGRSSKGLEFP